MLEASRMTPITKVLMNNAQGKMRAFEIIKISGIRRMTW
jgi:hypothetical protein